MCKKRKQNKLAKTTLLQLITPALRKCLLDHFFLDSPETDKTLMLSRLMGRKDRSSACNPKMLQHVCGVLRGDDDEKQLTDLRNEVQDAYRLIGRKSS